MSLIDTGCYQSNPDLAIQVDKGLGDWDGMGGMGQCDPTVQTCLPADTSASGGGGFWDFIGSQIASWSKTGQQILIGQNVPTTYTRRGPSGEIVTYTQQGGQIPFTAADVGGQIIGRGDTGMGLVLVAGVGVLLLFMLSRRG